MPREPERRAPTPSSSIPPRLRPDAGPRREQPARDAEPRRADHCGALADARERSRRSGGRRAAPRRRAATPRARRFRGRPPRARARAGSTGRTANCPRANRVVGTKVTRAIPRHEKEGGAADIPPTLRPPGMTGRTPRRGARPSRGRRATPDHAEVDDPLRLDVTAVLNTSALVRAPFPAVAPRLWTLRVQIAPAFPAYSRAFEGCRSDLQDPRICARLCAWIGILAIGAFLMRTRRAIAMLRLPRLPPQDLWWLHLPKIPRTLRFLPVSQALTYVGCSNETCPYGPLWESQKNTKAGSSGFCWWLAECGHNCTNYVGWRMAMDGVSSFLSPSANADGWKREALEAGLTVTSTPRVGAIAYWDKSTSQSNGHVAIVEAVSGSRVVIFARRSETGASVDGDRGECSR